MQHSSVKIWENLLLFFGTFLLPVVVGGDTDCKVSPSQPGQKHSRKLDKMVFLTQPYQLQVPGWLSLRHLFVALQQPPLSVSFCGLSSVHIVPVPGTLSLLIPMQLVDLGSTLTTLFTLITPSRMEPSPNSVLYGTLGL